MPGEPGEQQGATHQRNTGYAIGYSDRSQRRLSADEVKDESEGGGGAELLDAVKSQESELAHQMAALQHYNAQKVSTATLQHMSFSLSALIAISPNLSVLLPVSA